MNEKDAMTIRELLTDWLRRHDCTGSASDLASLTLDDLSEAVLFSAGCRGNDDPDETTRQVTDMFAAKEICTRERQQLAWLDAHGFATTGTGGGCMAYEKALSEGHYLMVTGDEANLPYGGEVAIGYFREDGDYIMVWRFHAERAIEGMAAAVASVELLAQERTQ